ncbi:MAG: DUF805 domain-containing protein [Pseudomonadales bacterium]|nr:DUF805 domain-containing protein [Pseudomonadales bacterium]
MMMEKLVLLFSGVMLLAIVLSFARIFRKAGFSGWWVILCFIPIGHIVLIISLAMREWPSLRDIKEKTPEVDQNKKTAITEEDAYELVAQELAKNLLKEGLWLKSKVQTTNTEEAKTKYVELRVRSILEGGKSMEVNLYKETASQLDDILNIDPKEEARKIIEGLNKT